MLRRAGPLRVGVAAADPEHVEIPAASFMVGDTMVTGDATLRFDDELGFTFRAEGDRKRGRVRANCTSRPISSPVPPAVAMSSQGSRSNPPTAAATRP